MNKPLNPKPPAEGETPAVLAQPPQAGAQVLDLDALRLPPNYGASLGVKRVLTTVPIGKPKPAQFFRSHPNPEWTIQVYIIEMKEDRETYVVGRSIAPILGNVVKPVLLHAAIDRGDNPFLIPVFLPGEDGRRSSWHESRAQAVEHAKGKWVRIVANMAAGAYDVLEAQGTLPDPTWPDCAPGELFQIAMRGRIIADETHPVVQQLLGRV